MLIKSQCISTACFTQFLTNMTQTQMMALIPAESWQAVLLYIDQHEENDVHAITGRLALWICGLRISKSKREVLILPSCRISELGFSVDHSDNSPGCVKSLSKICVLILRFTVSLADRYKAGNVPTVILPGAPIFHWLLSIFFEGASNGMIEITFHSNYIS